MSFFPYPVVSLENLAEKVDYGLTASATNSGNGPKFLRITDIQDDRVDWSAVPLCNCAEEDRDKYALSEGDIVFARTGATTGKSFLIRSCPSGAVFASYLIRVRPSAEVDSGYLARFFQTPNYWHQINKSSTGTAQAGVNASNLKKLTVPLPPIAEQRRIAAILDRADAVRRKRQAAIGLTEELLRSTFLEMFGDPVTNPKRWEVLPIGAISSRITKGESPKWQGYNYQNEGVLFVTSENVLWGQIDCSEPKFIPQQFHQKLNRSQLRANDVLINLVGASVGRTCLVPDNILPANVNQAVAVISVNEQICNSSFLLRQLLNHSVQRALLGQAVESARANISLTNIRELSVIVPPMKYQMQWKNFCQREESMFKQELASAQESDNLFNSLLQRAFRGEL